MATASQNRAMPPDSPEAIMKPRPWLEKFTAWNTLLRKGCPAATMKGVICVWIGRNCSFNDCPRRNFEEDELANEAVLKVEKLQAVNQNLRNQIQQKNAKINQLKKDLEG